MKNHLTFEQIIDAIRKDGFTRFSVPELKHNTVSGLYNQFQNISEGALHDEVRNDFNKYDSSLNRFLAIVDSPLDRKLLSLSKLNNNSGDGVVSFQYLKNFNKFLKVSRVELGPVLTKFLEDLEEVSSLLFTKIIDVLPEGFKTKNYTGLLKISMYRNVSEGVYLIPPHEDRTVFTLIVDTQNETRERLNLHLNDKVYSPGASDFPLLITGLAGQNVFGAKATSHSVSNLEHSKNERRFSLILFLLPEDLTG